MGLGRGWACIGLQFITLRVGLGPSRAEWGWGGVGNALGFFQNDSKTGLATRVGQVGPRGAGSGRVGPSRAE